MGFLTSSPQNDFIWTTQAEPHRSRRDQILKAHPEIQKFFVIDHAFKWKVSALVVFQIVSLFLFRNLSAGTLLVLSYFVAGTVNHSLMLAEHEIAHCQAFGYSRPTLNRWFGIWANLPIGVPMACSFKKYHNLHHRVQGVDGGDPDLPTKFEGEFFRSPAMKALWLLLQPAFYGIRPFLTNPIPLVELELANILIQIIFDALVVYFAGWHMLVYLLGGSVMSMGLHPIAGHHIAEHYMWKDGYETYSYFGPLNIITWNVGYHMAHHDFPNIPGSLLPEVHKLAPEFYEHLPYHTSWTWCLYEFITNPEMGPFVRIKRKSATSDDSKSYA